MPRNKNDKNKGSLFDIGNIEKAKDLVDEIFNSAYGITDAFNKTRNLEKYINDLQKVAEKTKEIKKFYDGDIKVDRYSSAPQIQEEMLRLMKIIELQEKSIKNKAAEQIAIEKEKEAQLQILNIKKEQHKLESKKGDLVKYTETLQKRQLDQVKARAREEYKDMNAFQKLFGAGSEEDYVQKRVSSFETTMNQKLENSIETAFQKAYENGESFNKSDIKEIFDEVAEETAKSEASVTFSKGVSLFSNSNKVFNVASKALLAGANELKNMFSGGMNNQKSAYRNNVGTIAAMNGLSANQQRLMQTEINNSLGSWMPYTSGNDLRDNVSTSEVMNQMGSLAKGGYNTRDTVDLYTRAIDNIVTKNIVPYLETSTVQWQQLVDGQPELQKNIRGINRTNNEIVGNNYATEKVLKDVLSDLQPMSQLAEDELAMSAAGATAAINTLMAAGMSEEAAIAEYKKTYKQRTQGADILQNGSTTEKMEMINLLNSGIDITDSRNIGQQIASNVRTDQNMVDLFGGSYNNGTMNAILTSIGVENMMNGDMTAALNYGIGSNLEDFDANTIATNVAQAQNKNSYYANQETNNFTRGMYQSEAEKQEIYMENMTNEVAAISEAIGHWGKVLKAGLNAVGVSLVDNLSGGVMGKSLKSLAKLAGGKGLLAAGGGIAIGAAATAAIFAAIQKANKTNEEYAEKKAVDDYSKSNDSFAKSITAQKFIGAGANQMDTSNLNLFGNWGRDLSNGMGRIGLRLGETKTVLGNLFDGTKGWHDDDFITHNRAYYNSFITTLGSKDPIYNAGLYAAYSFLLDQVNSLESTEKMGQLMTKEDLSNLFIETDENGISLFKHFKVSDRIKELVSSGQVPSGWDGEKANGNIDFKSVYGAPKGSYRIGLNRVPRDNFPALLHENEAVLTASTANELRGLLDEYRQTSQQSANFDIIIQNQTIALVNKMEDIIQVISANAFDTPREPNYAESRLKNSMRNMTNTRAFN